MALTFSAGASI
jgi:hypothetical protein